MACLRPAPACARPCLAVIFRCLRARRRLGLSGPPVSLCRGAQARSPIGAAAATPSHGGQLPCSNSAFFTTQAKPNARVNTRLRRPCLCLPCAVVTTHTASKSQFPQPAEVCRAAALAVLRWRAARRPAFYVAWGPALAERGQPTSGCLFGRFSPRKRSRAQGTPWARGNRRKACQPFAGPTARVGYRRAAPMGA